MLKVYTSDIERFGIDDWEDMLNNGVSPVITDWEGWSERGLVKFQLQDTIATREFPFTEFVLDMKGTGEPLHDREELDYLVDDVLRVKPARNGLFSALKLHDTDFEDEVNAASEELSDAYDSALCRVLFLLLGKAHLSREVN